MSSDFFCFDVIIYLDRKVENLNNELVGDFVENITKAAVLWVFVILRLDGKTVLVKGKFNTKILLFWWSCNLHKLGTFVQDAAIT